MARRDWCNGRCSGWTVARPLRQQLPVWGVYIRSNHVSIDCYCAWDRHATRLSVTCGEGDTDQPYERSKRIAQIKDFTHDPETIVTWALEGSEGCTRLTLVHSGFAPNRPTDDYTTGWHRFVNDLKLMIEIGSSWTEATTD